MTTHVCKVTGKDFVVTEEESEWYRKFDLPHPDLSVDERLRRKMAFYNERRFFWRKCSNTQRRIFSIFSPKTDFPVYAEDIWRSPSWDRLEYGVDFNPRQPFFEQLFDCWNEVPRPATWNAGVDRSSTVNDVSGVSDSFMLADARNVDHSCYSVGLFESSKCCDCYWVSESKGLYECVNCHGCQHLLFSSHAINCRSSAFLESCFDCAHCLFCSNLRGREYCVFNEQLTPEAYLSEVKRWNFALRPILDEARNRFIEFLAAQPLPAIISDIESAQGSILSGNYITRCKGLLDSYLVLDCSELRSATRVTNGVRVIDAFACHGELTDCAQIVGVRGKAQRVFNSFYCGGEIADLMYCAYCENSQHLFGCVALRDREYCIFNKQFSKEDYFKVRNEIELTLKRKRVWGKFFPAPFSDFSYNHSAAADYAPLNKYQCEMMSYKWDDTDETLKPSQLLGHEGESSEDRFAETPQRLSDADEAQLAKSLYLCEMTGRPYQITPLEFSLYREFDVVPPSRCFEQRHRERLSSLEPFRLLEREVEGVTVRTSFGPQTRRPVISLQSWLASLG